MSVEKFTYPLERLRREILALRWFALSPNFVLLPDEAQSAITEKISQVESDLWDTYDHAEADFRCVECMTTIRSADTLFVGITRDFYAHPTGYYPLCRLHKGQVYLLTTDRR